MERVTFKGIPGAIIFGTTVYPASASVIRFGKDSSGLSDSERSTVSLSFIGSDKVEAMAYTDLITTPGGDIEADEIAYINEQVGIAYGGNYTGAEAGESRITALEEAINDLTDRVEALEP